jgi:hypothetical protein
MDVKVEVCTLVVSSQEWRHLVVVTWLRFHRFRLPLTNRPIALELETPFRYVLHSKQVDRYLSPEPHLLGFVELYKFHAFENKTDDY